MCNYNNNPHSPNHYHIEKDVSNIKNNTNDKNENQMESKSNNEETKNIFHDYKPGKMFKVMVIAAYMPSVTH
jgi:hypothetical protein